MEKIVYNYLSNINFIFYIEKWTLVYYVVLLYIVYLYTICITYVQINSFPSPLWKNKLDF